MGGLPDLLFVIDTNKEDIAIKEAQRLEHSGRRRSSTPIAIPTASPMSCRATTTPSRAITLYCDLIARAAIDGISRAQGELRRRHRRGRRADRAKSCRRRRSGAGFEVLAGPRGVADDLKKLHRRVAGDREEAQRSRHLPLLADRRARPRRRAQRSAKRSDCRAACRWLGRPGQGADRRSGITRKLRPAVRPQSSAITHSAGAAEAAWPSRDAPLTGKRISTMATITAADGQGAARDDRRGHDGLQGGARRDRRATWRRPIDWLRKKGLAKAAKKAGRVAAEGLIGVAVHGHQGRRGRGQFGDRLRRAQRSVPGPGQDDRRCRARRSAPMSRRSRRRRSAASRSPKRSPTRSPRSART